MAEFATVLENSRQILNEYDLCDFCLGRLFVKKLGLTSSQYVGKKIHRTLGKKNSKCYICKNIFDQLDNYIEKMLDATSAYQFKTFLVGVMLKPSVLDKDDHIRSRFKLIGTDSIKTSINRHLVKKFAKKTKSRYQHLDPDITLTVNFKTESCTVHSKPIFIVGRYLKKIRGLPQKQKPCGNCLGKGCYSCGHHGIAEFNSVEGIISKYLFERFSATLVIITWVGGEDASSLVLGTGRPFFVKLVNPKKRRMKFPAIINFEKIVLKSLKLVTKIPIHPIRFVSRVKVLVKTQNSITKEDVKKLEALKTEIAIFEDSERKTKSIYDVKYRQTSTNSFVLYLKMDGGIPIKRLVSGDNIFPNVSQIISTNAVCEIFDFYNIKLLN